MLALVLGLLIGGVLGLTGAGGAIFALPLFTLLLHLPTQDAIALSLASVAIGAAIGSWQRRRDVIWLPTAAFASLGALLAPLGRLASQQIAETALHLLFVAVALFIAARMWRRAQRVKAATPEYYHCELNDQQQIRLQPRCMGAIALSGSATGFLSGLLGVGGGFLITPVLLRLTPARLEQVIATSLAVITASALSGALFSLPALRQLPGPLTLSLLGGIGLGVIAGALLAKRLDPAYIQRGFALLAVIAALSILLPIVF